MGLISKIIRPIFFANFMNKKISQILIASGNRGKFNEISALLKEVNIEAVPSFDFKLEEPEENGSTFEENSLIKAKYYAKKTGLISLADDSGLCIDALGGKPGIHSARFALDENQNSNFPKTFEKIFADKEKMAKNPNGHFICNLTIFDPEDEFSISFEGRADGKLVYPARGEKGFGYDPIFIKNGMDKTFGEIAAFEKDKISHRGEAFRKMMAYLKS